MILRVSADFTKRFKCELSFEGEKVPQEKRLDGWSCHFIRLGRKPLVVAMNDATLYMLIVPVTGVKGFTDVWLRLVGRIAEVWERHGADFDPTNQTVMVMARTNRSLIGSMSDAISLMRFRNDDARFDGQEPDLAELEMMSNRTPFKANGFEYPERVLATTLGAVDRPVDG